MSTDNFLVAEAQLVIEQARKEKAERLKTLGEPLELSGKALALEIKDGYAWIAENTSRIRKLDLESGKTLQFYKGHTGPVTSLAFCDRIVGSGDQEILITGSWDNTKQQISCTPKAHADFVKCFHVFPTLRLLISGSSDKVVRFWDLSQPENPEPLKSIGSISSHTRPVECLDGEATSDTSAILFTGDTMGVVKVWNLQKDTRVPPRWIATVKETITHHRTRINELRYGDDLGEPYLITAAGDILRTYDVSELDQPELLTEIDAHSHDITVIKLWKRKTTKEDGKTYIEPWIVTTSLDQTFANLLKPPQPPLKSEPAPEPKFTAVSHSELTEEEERELAELMEDD
ncbi:WD40-repeat-containing domain protein [Gymnopilus junonius]|uniref:WD40-repeat-containing domain protein n=1 Tax=Gymnopilus junonius TaxID=109634 RepID=A0A9P5TR44_GYMJU|nr:WD40-repeat-containing domain protein [Gymnopilus junonius]